MKTQKLLITLSAAVLTAITFNTTAAGLLSPRAAGNEIKTVAAAAKDPNLVAVDQGVAAAPRVAANRPAPAAGMARETSAAMACSRNMTASPKAVQACAANPAAAMPCCGKSAATAD